MIYVPFTTENFQQTLQLDKKPSGSFIKVYQTDKETEAWVGCYLLNFLELVQSQVGDQKSDFVTSGSVHVLWCRVKTFDRACTTQVWAYATLYVESVFGGVGYYSCIVFGWLLPKLARDKDWNASS